ncbi:hypothetical protein FRC09_018823 [Ceratobasidium sp. 395]|nr:hypothetical protein FRC09_018823 [Ceratobasidium sp. 395]
MRVMLNNTQQTRHAIKAQKLGDEVMIRVPRAASATHTSEMPFLDIGGKRLSIVVLPPHKEYRLGKPPTFQGKEYPKDGVKVINGEISWNEGSNRITRGIAVEAQKAKSMIPDAENNIVKAGPNGAIFVRLASSPITTLPDLKFEDMDDVATINNLPFSVDPAVRDMLFPWVRCSDREWGQGGFDWPFYNLVGYHVLYDDDSLTNFCHIQAWTLGIGETWWAKDAEADKHLQQNPNEIENVAKYANNVIVNDMEEHGPLWRMGSDGRPSLRPNDTVDYPYHAWLAGGRNKSHPPQAFDVWLAFEFPSSEFQEGRSRFNGCACC